MTRIRILPPARHDLVDGFRFYEKQAEGINRRNPEWIRKRLTSR